MNEQPKAIEWKFDGKDYTASIGYGLLEFVVSKTFAFHTADRSQWRIKIIGAVEKEIPEQFDNLVDAQLWAEHRAHVYAEQMLRELRASETGENVAESEASDD